MIKGIFIAFAVFFGATAICGIYLTSKLWKDYNKKSRKILVGVNIIFSLLTILSIIKLIP